MKEEPAYSFGNSKRVLFNQEIKEGTQLPIYLKEGITQSASYIKNYSQVAPAVPSWSFTKTERYGGKNYEGPSPVSYQPNVSYKCVKYSLGNSKRDTWTVSKHKEVPGPGSYNYNGALETPMYSMRVRPKDNGPVTPGPGSYYASSSHLKAAPRAVFGSSSRSKTRKTLSPGVGRYEVAAKLSHIGFSIGKGKRYGEPSQGKPGPGSYNIPSSIGRKL